MTATDELREAVEALYEVTVWLCEVCERSGMSMNEGSAISDAYKRYAKAMGKEWAE